MTPREKHRQITQVVEARRLARQAREMQTAAAQRIALGLEQVRDQQVEQLAADQRLWRQDVEGSTIALHFAPAWHNQFETAESALKATDQELSGAYRALDDTKAAFAVASGALDAANSLERASRDRLRRHADERLLGELADLELQRRRPV